MFNKNKPGSEDGGFNIPVMSDRTPAPTERRDVEPAAPRAPTPASAPRSTNLSTLTAGVRYEGNISGGGDIQIDGALKGDVRLARVVVGENGSVEGAVTADQVEVRGRVSGSITGKSVRLLATARVEGDITQEQLAIEPGAWFQGRSIQAKRELPTAASLEAPSATAEAPPKPERYKPEKPVAATMPGGTA
ncbi:polymer-forming cytoskeletal protein [Brevundimonas sp. NPDC092305]|uniref:bactofilin family protein n=1 Tax=Brevundimonas sp. NPDC092305 TaxID=3363957 RepID=UPI003800A94A